MVVLAASICTRGGKPLLSRSFRDISKDRITALLANFPNLLSNSGSQSTTIEDEAVRYVYLPLEELYVVLLTNKHSNILQDIGTLHLFVSVVTNLMRSIDEREVFEIAFEILSAFDEVITMGYKEKLTLSQVQAFLEMDSHEEKIQEIIERNKELEATEERRRRAKEIQRKELARRNLESQQLAIFGAGGMNAPSGMAGGGYGFQGAPTPSYEAPRVESDILAQEQLTPRKPGGLGGSGLQLGKKSGKVAHPDHLSQPLLTTNTPFASAPLVSDLVRPGTGATPSGLPNTAPAVSESATPQPSKPHNDGILITINEKISAELSREGSVTSSEVKGDLQLRINDADLAHSNIILKTNPKSGVQYKTHPNVDRNLFNSESIIGLKDKSKSFPSNDQSLGVLRWRATDNSDSTLLPLVLTAWVSVNDGVADVTLEYEIPQNYVDSHPTQESIDGVRILVPVALNDVQLKDDSEAIASYDLTPLGVVFTLALVPLSESQGAFEFSIPAADEDALFPMQVKFDITQSEGISEADLAFGQVLVVDVVSNDEERKSLPFGLHLNVTAESFNIN